MFNFTKNLKNMISIQGEHICKIDSKGRFLFPNGMKTQLGSNLKDGFIVKKSVFNNCLELYPRKNWDDLIQKITLKLNRFVRKHNDFIRAFTSGLKELDLDASGRVQVPRDLLLFANLGKEIVITAKLDCIEIWDKATYDKIIADTQLDISSLAEEVLGNIDLNI